MDKLFNAFDTKFTVCGKFFQKKNKTSLFQGYQYCFNYDIVRNRIGKKKTWHKDLSVIKVTFFSYYLYMFDAENRIFASLYWSIVM